MLYAVNKKIGCAPVKEANEVVALAGKALLRMALSNKLVKTKVVVGSASFPVGSTIYLKLSSARQPWCSEEIYKLDDQEVILVPEDAVVFCDVQVDMQPQVAQSERLPTPVGRAATELSEAKAREQLAAPMQNVS